MRLLSVGTQRFKDFADGDIPPYAILSHTWEEKHEVTLQDISSPYLIDKNGFAKITGTCQLASSRNLGFVWVDTCCIDKTNNTELTESINSMFRFYQNAAVCFVHLADLDVPQNPAAGFDISENIRLCAWFKRGWTLQELLAPRTVEFYDKNWRFVGSKEKLAPLISTITHIPAEAILGQRSVGSYSLAQRMAWAWDRKTTKVEDTAYCLLGLFDVNMPLIYGEGSRAFQRLQEEIVKHTTDLTLFAWMPNSPYTSQAAPDSAASPPSPADAYMPVLASTPAQFEHCHGLSIFRDDDCEFSVTHRGLRLTTYLVLIPLPPDPADNPPASEGSSAVSSNTSAAAIGGEPGIRSNAENRFRYVLSVGYIKSKDSDIGIWLKKIGPGLFLREANTPPVHYSKRNTQHTTTENHTFYVLMRPKAAIKAPDDMHSVASASVPPTPSDTTPGLGFSPMSLEEAETAASASTSHLRAIYHPRLFPRGLFIPYYGHRGIYFTNPTCTPWDERTRIYCRPMSRNDVVAFSCSSTQGHGGCDNLTFGILVDYRAYRENRVLPRCLVISRPTLESRFLFILSMRQHGDPLQWYVLENELPTISQSRSVLYIESTSAGGPWTYKVSAKVVMGPVQIDDQVVPMMTLKVKVADVTGTPEAASRLARRS